MIQKLKKNEVLKALKKLKNWAVIKNQLQKNFSFKNFIEAMAFVTQVSLLSESMNHHPDINIQYSKVTLTLSTHSAKGLTQLDFLLAEKIDFLTHEKT